MKIRRPESVAPFSCARMVRDWSPIPGRVRDKYDNTFEYTVKVQSLFKYLTEELIVIPDTLKIKNEMNVII